MLYKLPSSEHHQGPLTPGEGQHARAHSCWEAMSQRQHKRDGEDSLGLKILSDFESFLGKRVPEDKTNPAAQEMFGKIAHPGVEISKYY